MAPHKVCTRELGEAQFKNLQRGCNIGQPSVLDEQGAAKGVWRHLDPGHRRRLSCVFRFWWTCCGATPSTAPPTFRAALLAETNLN